MNSVKLRPIIKLTALLALNDVILYSGPFWPESRQKLPPQEKVEMYAPEWSSSSETVRLVSSFV